MTGFFFIVRHLIAWSFPGILAIAVTGALFRAPPWFVLVGAGVLLAVAFMTAFSHVKRVRLLVGRVDAASLANRQRRQVEIPLEAGEAFDLVDAAIRELPHVVSQESARDSLQVRAQVNRVDPYVIRKKSWLPTMIPLGPWRNQILATVTPKDGTGSLTLLCEPEAGPWLDWFQVDGGTNLENAEAITRAITRRVAERRRRENQQVVATVTEKELALARLNLLHAQVEPHFLYNTLASAQLLTRSDPARADRMLGHLIDFLRNSLPRAEETTSTLGAEVDRARAYLEILRIRLGERLRVQVEVPAGLEGVPLPPMMLQTLVENALKHGIEPVPGGGTIWLLARADGDRVSITVADDGRGFGEQGGGTGIGLRNVRERLRLAYGEGATFNIVANFPKGVAATITVPLAGPKGEVHA